MTGDRRRPWSTLTLAIGLLGAAALLGGVGSTLPQVATSAKGADPTARVSANGVAAEDSAPPAFAPSRLSSSLEAASARLRELGSDADPQGHLERLRRLHASVAELSSALEEDTDPSLPASVFLSRDGGSLRPAPELLQLRAALDAFFDLRMIREPPTGPCELGPEQLDFAWNPEALERFTALLEVTGREGLLQELRDAAAESKGPFTAVFDALPMAACGKLTQTFCVELGATREPSGDIDGTPLSRLRRRAESLREARDALLGLARAAISLGCGTEAFGLAEARQHAESVLEHAERELQTMTEELAARVAAKKDTAAKEDPYERAANGLRQYRLEVAAVVFGVAEPAVEYLEATGKDTETKRWRELSAALELPRRAAADARAVSTDTSGWGAFEQFHAELLLRGKQPCGVAFQAWSNDVFARGSGLFHAFGAELTRRLESTCHASEKSGAE